MEFVCKHSGEVPTAILTADSLIQNLVENLPKGAKLINPAKKWQGNIMKFSFGVKKGWLPTIRICGEVDVRDTDVACRFQIPPIAMSMVPEEQIFKTVAEKFA